MTMTYLFGLLATLAVMIEYN